MSELIEVMTNSYLLPIVIVLKMSKISERRIKTLEKKQQTTHIVRYLIRRTRDAPQTAIYHKLIHAYAVLHIINYLIS